MGSVGGAIGGLIGGAMGQSQREAGDNLSADALRSIQGVRVPSKEEMMINLVNQQLQGTYNPLLEQYMSQGPSAMQGITTDPRLLQAQMDALHGLQQRGEAGLTPEDKAALSQINRQTSAQQQAQDQAIMQQMAERGIGGGGNELAQRLMAAQKATDIANQQAQQQGALSFQAKMAALQGAGNLGNQMQQTSFGQQAQQANAADAIARFNLQNQMSTQQRNVGSQNQAQAQNLSAKQALEAQRVANANAQEMHNKGLAQDIYNMQSGHAQQVANALNARAKQFQDQADQEGAKWSAGGQAVGEIGAAIAGAPPSSGFSGAIKQYNTNKNASNKKGTEMDG